MTKEIVADYMKAQEVFEAFEGKIQDRITEVLRLVFDFFGAHLDTWYFPNAAEGEVGTMQGVLAEDDFLELIWEGKGTRTGKLYDYLCGSLPVKFLFMEDDAILKLIQKDIAAREDKKKKNDEAVKKRKIKKEAAKISARSKLTKAERKVLGIK